MTSSLQPPASPAVPPAASPRRRGGSAPRDFDLDAFLPYQLNRAAEAASARFQAVYRAEYGMTRTQWRVIAHLGQDGPMPAARICRLSHLDKTKVSRAVSALEKRGWLARNPADSDRRVEILALTDEGRRVRARLARRAQEWQAELARILGAGRLDALAQMLRELAALDGDAVAGEAGAGEVGAGDVGQAGPIRRRRAPRSS